MPNNENVQKEMDALQLEEMRFRVQQLRSQQQVREVRARSVEESLRAERINQERGQASCWHKKGGMGVESIMRGNDSNYAVAKHILPTGEMIVVCQRCLKLWTRPDPALIAKGASAEDRKLYAKQAREYQEAVGFPTDNSTSGSQIFVVTEIPQAA